MSQYKLDIIYESPIDVPSVLDLHNALMRIHNVEMQGKDNTESITDLICLMEQCDITELSSRFVHILYVSSEKNWAISTYEGSRIISANEGGNDVK